MAKTKTAGEKLNGTTETIENAFKTGTEALKANFDKAVKGYDQILGFQKDTVEAYVKAANVAGKGADDGPSAPLGLTFGFVVDRVSAALPVGNLYVNRSMIGAIVGSQPFGGEGLSGTGPKAGGPHYLPRFCTERVTSTDTTSSGGNATLLSLEDVGI